MEESTALPGIDAWLREDARGIVIKNTGNSPAENIHVTLVPLDIEYEIASLPAERTHEYPLSSMVSEVRLILRFENDKAELFLRTFALSAMRTEYDPFRPMIPFFRWKK
jgi:hypothetical protein